ncbi:prepilin-type N-terminal cleavage/methylation domain-containing protein [Acetobacter sp. TBRC 12305]|uniref:Prepilin-type N-terminal cleavage/methylation domain-containing protein n=1 Tax=Acetobacter garciniae TaxID=2817435 RepID=A0A939HKF8_9PROT|nr:prepilin-type N-terminal cleavage/methylation domain-containing protein [Acetobacter garciniae]MBO1325127.1 prepilin-type N-terminal cleavage/methylation domain-containing protein [Acetobacter garciniae]MBX0344902.1 prepilin-type N-terminal cleavage/methylation domain-containing protein [Acetobacter garciniae]
MNEQAPPRGRVAQGGFTLLELLVALVVFSLVLLVLEQGFRAATMLFERQRSLLDGQAELGAFDRVLRGLIAQADPGSGPGGTSGPVASLDSAAGGEPTGGLSASPTSSIGAGGGSGLFFVGQAHGLALRTVLPQALRAAAGMGADGQADIRLGVDGAHRLILGWVAYRHVIAPAMPVRQQVLLAGVQDMECAYFSNGNWKKTWYGDRLPELVRIGIRFVPRDGRHWPDIVAAPLRDPMP